MASGKDGGDGVPNPSFSCAISCFFASDNGLSYLAGLRPRLADAQHEIQLWREVAAFSRLGQL